MSLMSFASLTDFQKQRILSMPVGDYSFSDHVFKGKDRLTVPFNKYSEPDMHPDIRTMLHKIGYAVKDNKAYDMYDRQIKPSRAISNSKLPKQEKTYAEQIFQGQVKPSKNLRITYTRNPLDVAGMSSGKEWTSCLHLKKDAADIDGAYSDYVPNELLHGTHVAYLHHKDDKNLERPLARIALRPFVSESGHKILHPVKRVYGKFGLSPFENQVKRWTKKHFPLKNEVYRIPTNLYRDDDTDRLSKTYSKYDARDHLRDYNSSHPLYKKAIKFFKKHDPNELLTHEGVDNVKYAKTLPELRKLVETADRFQRPKVLKKIKRKYGQQEFHNAIMLSINSGRLDSFQGLIHPKKLSRMYLNSLLPTRHYAGEIHPDHKEEAFYKMLKEGDTISSIPEYYMPENHDYTKLLKDNRYPDAIIKMYNRGDKKTQEKIKKLYPWTRRVF